MELEFSRHPVTLDRHWHLVITQADYDRMRLDPGDRMILDDCDGPDATISDRLLGLELIARRVEEGRLERV